MAKGSIILVELDKVREKTEWDNLMDKAKVFNGFRRLFVTHSKEDNCPDNMISLNHKKWHGGLSKELKLDLKEKSYRDLVCIHPSSELTQQIIKLLTYERSISVNKSEIRTEFDIDLRTEKQNQLELINFAVETIKKIT